MKDTRGYLVDLLSYIDRIRSYAPTERVIFDENLMLQDAILRNFEIIGEIAKRIPNELLDITPEANWADVKRFRDYLAHHYEPIDLDIVWDSIATLPNLRAAVVQLLAVVPPSDDE